MTNETPAKADDLGAALKKIRTQRGWSLESVQQKTRIPRKFIEAMEGNRFQDLPGPVYRRGFLRTYCEFLDIEFDPVWQRVSGEIEKPPVGAPPPPPPPAAPGPSAAVWIGALAALIVVVAIVRFVVTRPGGAPPLPPPSEGTPITPLETTTPAPPPPPKAKGAPMTLDLEFPSRTWLRIEADGRVRFEGWVPAGSRQSWTATGSFQLRTPTPDAIKASVDTKPLSLGALKRSVDGDITIDGQ